MIKEDYIINRIVYGDVVKKIAEDKGIELSEARQELSKMSFIQYYNLVNEAGSNIIPPSGNPLGQNRPNVSQQRQTPTSRSPQNIKSIWQGVGAPIEVGMTVGLRDQSGMPIPGTISQVDKSAKGVKVKNPTTGQDEWMNTDLLEPYIALPDDNSANNLRRLRELAGISENSSAGATAAGAIAIAPVNVGKIQRRQPTEEKLKKEYVRKEPAKTVIGDTKSHQASGELSATLAANGKKTASRVNNGIKRR